MCLRPVLAHYMLVRTNTLLMSGTEDRVCAGIIFFDLLDQTCLIFFQLSEELQQTFKR